MWSMNWEVHVGAVYRLQPEIGYKHTKKKQMERKFMIAKRWLIILADFIKHYLLIRKLSNVWNTIYFVCGDAKIKLPLKKKSYRRLEKRVWYEVWSPQTETRDFNGWKGRQNNWSYQKSLSKWFYSSIETTSACMQLKTVKEWMCRIEITILELPTRNPDSNSIYDRYSQNSFLTGQK